MKHTCKILFLFFLLSCSESKPAFYSLGLKSFNADNLSLAKNQFSMVKSDDPRYESAQHYIRKIDSVEKVRFGLYEEEAYVKQRRKDSLMQKHAGNYKIEVIGLSSKDAVEVYLLKEDGDADWLWVYDIAGTRKIDDRSDGWWSMKDSTITISIRGNSGIMEEVYKLDGEYFRNVDIKKRFLVKTNKLF